MEEIVTAADENKVFRREVARRIRAAVDSGAVDFTSILRSCEGADPILVKELYDEEFPTRPLTMLSAADVRLDPTDPRLSLRLPAPDPAKSQWWFTSAAIGYLSDLVQARAMLFDKPKVLCIGAPSIGHYMAHRGNPLDILDIDLDVINALQPLPSHCSARQYDAADPLPVDLVGQATVAILDPPWYEAAMRTFLARALDGLQLGGEVIVTMPPRLTRPGIEAAMAVLLDDLMKAGHEILNRPGFSGDFVT